MNGHSPFLFVLLIAVLVVVAFTVWRFLANR
jgi:hypothetical protein